MKKLLIILIMFFTINTFSYAEFSDINDSHWGYNAVFNMASNEILSGYPDGSFKPNNNITLAEYASIFTNFFSIEENAEDNYFINVDKSYWAKGKIEAMRQYIQPSYDSIDEYLGINENAFEDGISANMPVTREVVIYSLASILALDESNYTVGDEIIFADYEDILYPKYAVLLYKNNILSGEVIAGKTYLAPERYISRVEIASIFNKLLLEGKKISNIEDVESFNNVLNNMISLIKEYKLDEAKQHIYDSNRTLENINFNNLVNKDIKNVINKYFNKLEYNITDYGFYSYNKAYIIVSKKCYDYTEVLKTLENTKIENINQNIENIGKNFGKYKLNVIEKIEIINFIKNNNEWKIEL